MSTITVRLNDKEDKLFREYATFKGISISDLVKQSIANQIEDELDIKVYDEALAEFEANPITYTHDEVMKELGLSE